MLVRNNGNITGIVNRSTCGPNNSSQTIYTDNVIHPYNKRYNNHHSGVHQCIKFSIGSMMITSIFSLISVSLLHDKAWNSDTLTIKSGDFKSVIECFFEILLFGCYVVITCFCTILAIRNSDNIRRIFKCRFNIELYAWFINSAFTSFLIRPVTLSLHIFFPSLVIHILVGNLIILLTFILLYFIPEKQLLKRPMHYVLPMISLCSVVFILFATFESIDQIQLSHTDQQRRQQHDINNGITSPYDNHTISGSDGYVDNRKSIEYHLLNDILTQCVLVIIFSVLFKCYFIEFKNDRTHVKKWELSLKFLFIPVRLFLTYCYCCLSEPITQGSLNKR